MARNSAPHPAPHPAPVLTVHGYVGKLIDKLSFQMPVLYAAGHVINANEAGALNQTLRENLGNSYRPFVKDCIAKGMTQNEIQDLLTEKFAAYRFGGSTGGSFARAPRDPVAGEIFNLAKVAILAKLAKINSSLTKMSQPIRKNGELMTIGDLVQEYAKANHATLEPRARAIVAARASEPDVAEIYMGDELEVVSAEVAYKRAEEALDKAQDAFDKADAVLVHGA